MKGPASPCSDALAPPLWNSPFCSVVCKPDLKGKMLLQEGDPGGVGTGDPPPCQARARPALTRVLDLQLHKG